MEQSVAEVLATALEHHRHGRLAEAEVACQRVLQRVPNQPDALHRLGLIAYQLGRHERALRLIERAIAIDPNQPTYRNDAGIVLHATGRLDAAMVRYRESLAIEPANSRAFNGLGIVQKDRGMLDAAADSFRAALSVRPGYLDAHNNLATLLFMRGRFDEARDAYRAALDCEGGSPRIWNNIMGALCELGAYAEAAVAARKSLALDPDRAEVFEKLGEALLGLGQPDAAAEAFARALRGAETPASIAGFVEALAAAKLQGAGNDVKAMARRALATPWSRPSALTAPAIRIVADAPAVRASIDRASSVWPARLDAAELFGDAGRDAVFSDLLLLNLLECAPICDLAMERFLTQARRALMLEVDEAADACDAHQLAFCCALARQCFINDYVFATDDGESERVEMLRDLLAESLERGEAPSPLTIAMVATYVPLLSIAGTKALLSGKWPEPVAALVKQQIVEPLEEQSLRHGIPRLTPIDDETSIRVRRQYEEHPYPRWVKLPAGGGVRTATDAAQDDTMSARRHAILVAGCGTGQESIEIASRHPHSRVLAVDLSLASLAYAERKARELGIRNVEHSQADLTMLQSAAGPFDVVWCVGVLHHLAEPLRAWRHLLSMLVPGGQMFVGLYSERSRHDVVAARAFIAERGYAPIADDIRRCRQDLMAADGGHRFARLASRADFYVTGECRDLLFHVCEHRFTLRQVRDAIDGLGVSFRGFVLAPSFARRFAERHGSDAGLDPVERWEEFEAEFPDVFAGMYILCVQKDA